MIYPLYIPYETKLYEIRLSGTRVHSIVVMDDEYSKPEEITIDDLPAKVRRKLDQHLEHDGE